MGNYFVIGRISLCGHENVLKTVIVNPTLQMQLMLLNSTLKSRLGGVTHL